MVFYRKLVRPQLWFTLCFAFCTDASSNYGITGSIFSFAMKSSEADSDNWTQRAIKRRRCVPLCCRRCSFPSAANGVPASRTKREGIAMETGVEARFTLYNLGRRASWREVAGNEAWRPRVQTPPSMQMSSLRGEESRGDEGLTWEANTLDCVFVGAVFLYLFILKSPITGSCRRGI